MVVRGWRSAAAGSGDFLERKWHFWTAVGKNINLVTCNVDS